MFHVRRWEVRRHLPLARDKDVVDIGREVDRRHLRHWQLWAWSLVFGAALLIVPATAHDLVEPTLGATAAVAVLWLCLLVLLILFTVVLMGRESRIAREVAHEYGYTICINCGYDLRGAGDESGRCPECGATIRDQSEDAV